MQLTLLVTSPRVAPGLLTWSAWQAVAHAGQVCASDTGAPLARAVRAAGHRVDQRAVSDAHELLGLAAQRDTVWLATDDEAGWLSEGLAAELVGAGEQGRDVGRVEVMHGSYDVPGARLLDLVTVMDRLRTQCPWDREQTHRSLAPYLLEETYETLEAIETGDGDHLREELGDLLLQVYFHARIAAEEGVDTSSGAAGDPGGPSVSFDIDDVAGGIVDKMVHRHPHVFAGVEVADADEVATNWETLKAAEKRRDSVLAGIPWAMPALSLAAKVLSRRPVTPGPPEPADPSAEAPNDSAVRIGESLLQLVERARGQNVDPEQALRDAVRRLAAQIERSEQT